MSLSNQRTSKSNQYGNIITRLNLPLIGVIGLFLCAMFTSIFFYSQINGANLVINELESKYTELLSHYESSIDTANILNNYYSELLNNYAMLESSYEYLQEFSTELQNDIIELREDQTRARAELETRYKSLLSEKESLLNELDDITNFRKYIVLESNKTLVIEPKGNITLSYNTTYAGYINLNVSSTSEIIIWIGSSVANDTYYARLPPSFPDTIIQGSFTIPTTHNTYIHVINPNEFSDVHIELSLIFTY